MVTGGVLGLCRGQAVLLRPHCLWAVVWGKPELMLSCAQQRKPSGFAQLGLLPCLASLEEDAAVHIVVSC